MKIIHNRSGYFRLVRLPKMLCIKAARTGGQYGFYLDKESSDI
jgi:hypothetical protein